MLKAELFLKFFNIVCTQKSTPVFQSWSNEDLVNLTKAIQFLLIDWLSLSSMPIFWAQLVYTESMLLVQRSCWLIIRLTSRRLSSAPAVLMRSELSPGVRNYRSPEVSPGRLIFL